jgi:flagellar P-ring protein precursor FlgI
VVAFAVIVVACAAAGHATPEVRIKEITELLGVRDNQLLGVGLVTGLAGKGDSSGSALLQEAVSNLASSFGLTISADQIKSRNAAVVMVSAELPPFARPGERITLAVSSLGDARSLEGGVLLQTPLRAANGQVYAVGQGRVTIAEGARQVETVGSVAYGAIVEREVLSDFLVDGRLSFLLSRPDFTTAAAVAGAIRGALPELVVATRDASLIEVLVPEDRRDEVVSLIGQIESLVVRPDAGARVVIDSQSGILVMGEEVRIGKVAVSYESVDVTVGAASSFYSTLDESETSFVFEETTSVDDFVSTLRAVGLETKVVIEILKALDRAGALYGTLIVM